MSKFGPISKHFEYSSAELWLPASATTLSVTRRAAPRGITFCSRTVAPRLVYSFTPYKESAGLLNATLSEQAVESPQYFAFGKSVKLYKTQSSASGGRGSSFSLREETACACQHNSVEDGSRRYACSFLS